MFQKPSPDIAIPKQHESSHTRDEVETVVGPSVNVEGDFASEGNIVVKGTVSGSVKTSRMLTVETGAKILASVRAGDAMIAGEIKGNVKVAGTLELAESAQVKGDITCETLIVTAGALIHGKVSMTGLPADDAKEKKRRSATRRATKSEESE